MVEERHSKNEPAQTSVEGRIRTKEERDEVNMHVANFFYESGIPLNAINARSFEIMCEAIGQYGPGYKPPSYHEVRVPLLAKAVEQINKLKEKHECRGAANHSRVAEGTRPSPEGVYSGVS